MLHNLTVYKTEDGQFSHAFREHDDSIKMNGISGVRSRKVTDRTKMLVHYSSEIQGTVDPGVQIMLQTLYDGNNL